MRKILLGLTVFAFVFLSVTAVESGSQKARKLRQLQADSANGLIEFNSTGYQYFIMEAPRPYDVVVFYTAKNIQYCDEIQAEYLIAAEHYYKSGALQARKEGDKVLKPVFFGVVTFSESFKEIYSGLQFNSVPNLLVSLPKLAYISKEERFDYVRNYKWTISQTDGHVTSSKILDFINKRTDWNVTYKVSMFQAFTTILVFLFVVGSAFSLFWAFKPYFLKWQVWFLGSFTIYLVCIAGVVYNIIHNVPWSSVNRKGETMFFSDQQRSQLGAEGFFMSSLIGVAGLGFIALSTVHRYIEDKQQKFVIKQDQIFSFVFDNHWWALSHHWLN